MKKPTLATVKKFIKDSGEDLVINTKSVFSSSDDGVRDAKFTGFTKALKEEYTGNDTDNQLGIWGAWFVFGSRDYISTYEDELTIGFEISNSCGCFILAKAK